MQIDALYPKMFGTWTDYAKKYCNAHYRCVGQTCIHYVSILICILNYNTYLYLVVFFLKCRL